MSELEEMIQNLDSDEYSYYYHITGKGRGDEIIENGLFLEEPNINTTTIKMPTEMINNPVEYCENEYMDGLVKREEMIIIVVPKGDEKYLVERCNPIWIGNEKFEYIISNENILCYIDLKDLDVTYNLECQYGGKHV